MTENEYVKLHDRATRGESLTADEQQKLQKWYKAQDRAEDELINHGAAVQNESWRDELNAALNEITQTSGENEKIAAQNEILRLENEKLRRTVESRLLKETV